MFLYPYYADILKFFDKYGNIVMILIVAIVIFITGIYTYIAINEEPSNEIKRKKLASFISLIIVEIAILILLIV